MARPSTKWLPDSVAIPPRRTALGPGRSIWYTTAPRRAFGPFPARRVPPGKEPRRMKRHGRALRWLLPAASIVLAGLLASARGQPGQQFIQYGFESRDPVFVRGSADARFTESAHRLTEDLIAHTGKRSEFFQFDAEPGSFIHYTYDVGRAPVSDEL